MKAKPVVIDAPEGSRDSARRTHFWPRGKYFVTAHDNMRCGVELARVRT